MMKLKKYVGYVASYLLYNYAYLVSITSDAAVRGSRWVERWAGINYMWMITLDDE